MSASGKKNKKDQKLKSALRENLKKRKAFSRKLKQDKDGEPIAMRLRERDIARE